jgi:hypothetical protein
MVPPQRGTHCPGQPKTARNPRLRRKSWMILSARLLRSPLTNTLQCLLSPDLVFALDFGADERCIENHLSAASGPLGKPPHQQSTFRVAVGVAISRPITAALDRSTRK